MLRFLLRRLATTALALWLISVVVFAMGRLSGDPAAVLLSVATTAEDYARMKSALHLDDPLYIQYWDFTSNVAKGNLGRSFYYKQDVRAILLERLPNTLKLAFVAFVFALAVGIPLGVVSAVRRGGLLDWIGKTAALTGQAIPVFWLGIMLIFLFSVKLKLLPPSGMQGWQSIVLPAITLGWFFAAVNLRLIRSSMLEVMDSEYIKLARAKGLPGYKVIWKHALRNAMIPPLTFAGITIGLLISGSVVTETVFAWPGMGRLAIEALTNADYPLLQGVVLFSAAMYLICALLVDLAYAAIDPRIRYT